MPQADLDAALEPVGVLIGVFTTDAGLERRHMIRQSYASHWRSRREGTEGMRIKFVMGRPRKRYEKAIQLEMEGESPDAPFKRRNDALTDCSIQ